jgi:uncharacterized protein YbjQ (UPF0145 family)
MTRAIALIALAGIPACAETTTECCLVQAPRPQPPPPGAVMVSEPCELSGVVAAPASQVLVLQSTHTDRLTEVVGVIDVHAEMGGHDAALDMLKARAAQLGADAVLGVEFHHGHGEEEPTHLSGLAVRFIDGVR